jgi:hypothetical protein
MMRIVWFMLATDRKLRSLGQGVAIEFYLKDREVYIYDLPRGQANDDP